MKSDATDNYHARMRRVLEHVDANLDGDLSGETLSGVAAFSKHHFHRQFAELYGVTVHAYVQQARMRAAALRLAYRPDTSILQIALAAGYEGPEAFARAFKQHTGQTPSGFRKEPDWRSWRAAAERLEQVRNTHMQPTFTDDQVRIVDFPETRVAVLEHRGDPATVGDNVRRFIEWRKRMGVVPPASKTFNLLYAPPSTVAPEDYRLDICASVDGEVAPNEEGIVGRVIPAGRCAVLRQRSSGHDLRPAATYLYREWLPRSGEELRDFPLFAQRLSFFPEGPGGESEADLFLPLK